MCVRSWGLVRDREFMGGQEFGVSVESRPICPQCIERLLVRCSIVMGTTSATVRRSTQK